MEQEFFWRLKRVVGAQDLGPRLDYDFYHHWHDMQEANARPGNEFPSNDQLRELASESRPNPAD